MVVVPIATASSRPSVYVASGKPEGALTLVGHNSLDMRGMNAAMAISGNYAYIGSRTDGLHPNSGIMVVDISDPSNPTVVNQIEPGPTGDAIGETSRELRIWPQQNLLIVQELASNCSYLIHECSPTSAVGKDHYDFYDIAGDNAKNPKLITSYFPSADPHEFFLWVDPKNPTGRALMYMSNPASGVQFTVADISAVRKTKKVTEIGKWQALIPGTQSNQLHSLSISTDGKIAYMAALTDGFFELDVSQFAAGKPKPQARMITPMDKRPHWAGPGDHSSVKLFGRPYVLTTDEVYGNIPVLLSNHGCPWGWVRLIDIKDPAAPKVVSEYKLPQNDPKYCSDNTQNTPLREHLSSWSAHNPTLTKHIGFVTWHSGGLQAIDLTDPTHPTQAASFSPTPEPVVVTEDPILSSGQDKVVMWSYPIIKDGLIYVVDIRNGLYILRYKGPWSSEVSNVSFLEGNSNLGDALKFEKP
jgi:hypothetical protein